jgi:class 3 adenylate cyclase/CHASE2 domain-containing sensor protein
MISKLLAHIAAFRSRGGIGAFAIFLIVVGLSTALATYAVQNVSFLTSGDRFVHDYLIAAYTPPAPRDPDIIIVALDEPTVQTLQYRSPIDRAYLAKLLTVIAAKHPRAIGLDILVDQQTEPAKDEALRRTIASLPVPIVVAYTEEKGVESQGQTDQLRYLKGFVPKRLRALVNISTDQTDTVRWVYPGGATSDGYLPSFPRALAAKAGVLSPAIQLPIIWHGTPSGNPADRAFDEYPAIVVTSLGAALPDAWVKNKLVLVGSHLTLIDRHRTPFSTLMGDGDAGMPPGIVIQAHALSQLLHRTPSPYASWLVNLLFTLVCAAAGAAFGTINLHLAPRVAAGVALIVALWASGFFLFQYGNTLIELVAPTIAAIAAFGAMDSLAGLEARRKREFIQGAMSRYLSKRHVEDLLKNPAKLSLEGERREMTFLFTDVKDFTTMSEGLESKDLAPLLNSYLEGITQIVHAHEGIIDKFIGDAVFAIFNPPILDLPGHAEAAVRCAREIDRFCHAYSIDRTSAGINFGITRIGVNTGVAAIGNFGSEGKYTYTAQGDAVNTASRLEGLNKHLGTRLCVADSTRQQCNTLRFRPIASVVLKGKTTAVKVWEPVSDDMTDAYLKRYGDAFDKLEKGAPDAKAAFEALAREAPDDPCVQLHLERIAGGEPGVEIRMTEK